MESSREAPTMLTDNIFATERTAQDFVFDESVARVFDDMVSRSVPFYGEVQRMVVELSSAFLSKGGVFYDVGCSTASTIAALLMESAARGQIRAIGIDPSKAMLAQATEKLSAHAWFDHVELKQARIEDLDALPDASVVTMLYTLQFIRPINRLRVLEMIRRSLRPGGCLIVSEKVLADEAFARRLYIDLYHRYKRSNGYSDTEIAQKREALENVLVPFRNSENIELMRDAGFQSVEQAFRWYNFAMYVALK